MKLPAPPRPYALAAASAVWIFLLAPPALACRYNVRDLGFFDREGESYTLCLIVKEDAPEALVSKAKEVASAALRDSNIEIEVVHRGREKDHPALKDLPPDDGSPLSAALASPDGFSLPIPLTRPGEAFEATASAALRALVSSPKREEIVRGASQSFAVVLSIAGPDPGEDARARDTISKAIEGFKDQMAELPKPVARPPLLVAIDRGSLEREKILLWSLGLEPGKIDGPRAAVIYGKARWIGPVMEGDEITERNIVRIFSIVGADCECGLDLSWIQGTRLPVLWDPKTQEEAVKDLGFDPENPMVRIEIARILEKRSPGEGTPVREAPAGGGTGGPRGKTLPSEAPPAGGGGALRGTIYALLGLAALALGASLSFLLRAKRKKIF